MSTAWPEKIQFCSLLGQRTTDGYAGVVRYRGWGFKIPCASIPRMRGRDSFLLFLASSRKFFSKIGRGMLRGKLGGYTSIPESQVEQGLWH